jgi:hypothetical protein
MENDDRDTGFIQGLLGAGVVLIVAALLPVVDGNIYLAQLLAALAFLGPVGVAVYPRARLRRPSGHCSGGGPRPEPRHREDHPPEPWVGKRPELPGHARRGSWTPAIIGAGHTAASPSGGEQRGGGGDAGTSNAERAIGRDPAGDCRRQLPAPVPETGRG